ncbi:TPA: ASCH domain-containing protein [Vibrio parahaemolyticus]|nr:ASCH domain-containing protein [Vibrio parahaemolyticus]
MRRYVSECPTFSRQFQGGNLKALSVVQPWGSLIAKGTKSLEIRSWSPEKLPIHDIALVQNEVRLTANGQEDPNGIVIAIIDIVGCRAWDRSDCESSGCDESEFEEGWLAWEITNVRELNRPIPAIAKRGFYELTKAESDLVHLASET